MNKVTEILVVLMTCLVVLFAALAAANAGPFKPAVELTPEQMARHLYASVGQLEVRGREVCTVTKIAPRKYLSAKHCVADRDTKAEFSTHDGKYRWVNFRSMEIPLEKAEDKDHYEDWAIFSSKIQEFKDDDKEIPAIEMACHYKPKIGETVYYMGFPGTRNTRGQVRLFGKGYVSGVFEESEKKLGGHFTFDAPGAGGSSGSAVVNRFGLVIGVLTRVEIGDRDIIGLIAEGIKSLDVCEDAAGPADGPSRYGVKPVLEETPDPSPF
jgi:V8-like Glu-specific endopeptidase